MIEILILTIILFIMALYMWYLEVRIEKLEGDNE